jgi:hypothetical protein
MERCCASRPVLPRRYEAYGAADLRAVCWEGLTHCDWRPHARAAAAVGSARPRGALKYSVVLRGRAIRDLRRSCRMSPSEKEFRSYERLFSAPEGGVVADPAKKSLQRGRMSPEQGQVTSPRDLMLSGATPSLCAKTWTGRTMVDRLDLTLEKRACEPFCLHLHIPGVFPDESLVVLVKN